MKVERVIEWYDGPLLALVSDGDGKYFSVCMRIDFDGPLNGSRTYLLVRLDDVVSVNVDRAVDQFDGPQLHELASILRGRDSAVAMGSLEDISTEYLVFEPLTGEFEEFFVFPLIDKLESDWAARRT